jgi:hypothetical protein
MAAPFECFTFQCLRRLMAAPLDGLMAAPFDACGVLA